MRAIALFAVFHAVVLTILGALGWAVADFWGLAIMIALEIVTSLYVLFFGDRIFMRALRRQYGPPQPPGPQLSFTLNRALNQSATVSSRPFFAPYVFAEAAPNLAVVRAWGRPGTVVLSRGLISVLDESELREVVRVAGEIVKSPDTPFRTFFCVLAGAVARILPGAWADGLLRGQIFRNGRGGATVRRVLGFLIVYPVLRWMLSFAGAYPALANAPGTLLWANATRKMFRLATGSEMRMNPGWIGLWLIVPREMDSIISMTPQH